MAAFSKPLCLVWFLSQMQLKRRPTTSQNLIKTYLFEAKTLQKLSLFNLSLSSRPLNLQTAGACAAKCGTESFREATRVIHAVREPPIMAASAKQG